MWDWQLVQLKPVRFLWFAWAWRFSKELRSNPDMQGVRFMAAWRLFDHFFTQEIVEYPKGTVHEPGSILELTDEQVKDFAPGLIEPVSEADEEDK